MNTYTKIKVGMQSSKVKKATLHVVIKNKFIVLLNNLHTVALILQKKKKTRDIFTYTGQNSTIY